MEDAITATSGRVEELAARAERCDELEVEVPEHWRVIYGFANKRSWRSCNGIKS